MNRIAQAPDTEPDRQQAFLAIAKDLVEERTKREGRAPSFHVTTFGCQMNARDSEKLEGVLTAAGYVRTDSEDADFVIYNTCTVRENANQKVYGHLGRLKALKEMHPDMKIALCGCMMQEIPVVEKLQKSYRFVDLIFGTFNIFKFAELLVRVLSENGMVVDVWKDSETIVEEVPTLRKYAFKSGVNIMFGCDNFCSYCIVPYVRGREKSRLPGDILAEIRALASDGVREIMLLGQNVNSYGKNLAHPVTFAALLEEAAKIEGIRRIRFMTSHPKDLSDELIAVMARHDKICNHLHLPLQSGSSRILARMNRRYDKEGYLALVDKIRSVLPDIAITTDIIVGFPGETEGDFEETLDVVDRVRFDGAFTFIYSKRFGTKAAAYPDQVPADVIQRRFARLLAKVRQMSKEAADRLVGSVVNVLIEEINAQDPSLLTGRLANNMLVHFPGDASLIGTFADVELTTSKGFYFTGRKRS